MPPTAAHRASTLKDVLRTSAARKSQTVINHYQCTDWLRYNYQTDAWDYAGTTCQYIDSFEVPDGSGIIPGGGKVVGMTGAGNPDRLVKSCATVDPSKPDDKTPFDKAANSAESRLGSASPNYEYAGFIVRGPDGVVYYTQGQLLELSDNLATIGSVPDHQANLPPGYIIVGLYHTHPGTNPSMTDVNTGTRFSQADVDYANQYGIDIYVMDLWTDTSSGTAVERTAFFRYDHNTSSHTDKDVGAAGKC
ncbi:MAG TPA: hypothetical protein VGD01_15095 [Candidatus Elarobacter sp.]